MDCPIQLRVLQLNADFGVNRLDSHVSLQAENVVRVLSDGDDDAVNMQTRK